MIKYSNPERPINKNCVKYSGEWYFQQEAYPWEFRRVMKEKYKDVIFCPFLDSGRLDKIMSESI